MFAITGLGKQNLLLRHSWLQPEIDWVKGEVKMSRCPPHCCSRCQDELHLERIIQKTETKRMDTCSTGSLPTINHDSEDSNSDDSHDSDPESRPLCIE